MSSHARRKRPNVASFLAAVLIVLDRCDPALCYFADWSALSLDDQPTCVPIPRNLSLCHGIGYTKVCPEWILWYSFFGLQGHGHFFYRPSSVTAVWGVSYGRAPVPVFGIHGIDVFNLLMGNRAWLEWKLRDSM